MVKRFNRDFEQERRNYIDSLESKCDVLEARLEDLCNSLWALVHPDNPTGWEHPSQVCNHIKLYIKELKEKAV